MSRQSVGSWRRSVIEEKARQSGSVVLSDGWNGLGGRIFRDPVASFVAQSDDDVAEAVSAACRAADRGLYVAGFVAYEAGPAFDAALPARQADVPLIWMAAFERSDVWRAPQEAERHSTSLRLCDPAFEYSRGDYRAKIASLREHIRQGDVYQVNFTGMLDFVLDGPAFDLFVRLMAVQPVPYGAYIETGDVTIVSCSPELFFDRRGRHVRTRPMKGTVRRGSRDEEDEALSAWLSGDEKSRAENLMIVDLLRNDLSRCCEPGSVRVPALFTTERYETVIQMTSEVTGRLRPASGTSDVLTSLFPCGSITGAPKVRAAQIIRNLEAGPRGVYCGAIGIMHQDRAVFSVAIRTAEVRGRRGRLGIGSGIVWDSEADAEYDECLLKARFLTDLEALPEPAGADDLPARGNDRERRLRRARGGAEAPCPRRRLVHGAALIETMRAEGGDVALLEYHVNRIRRSARALGYPFDEDAFRQTTAAAVSPEGVRKVRVTLDGDGTLAATAVALEELTDTVWRVRFAEERIHPSDEARRHKTTDRRGYDLAYQDAVEAGLDEVLFLNERGEVAEGSRTNVFAAFGTSWITPPVSSGALPGVYRRFLLDSRESTEVGVITVADLLRADAVYLCNAVRGLVRARLYVRENVLI